MMINTPLDLNKEVNFAKLVTNPNPIDTSNGKHKGSPFTKDGVFSQKIFGNLQSSVTDWSCECGELQSEFNKGVTCRECGEPVEFRGLSLQNEGWIDMGGNVIHPLFYRYLVKLVGKSALLKLLKYKAEIDTTGAETPPEIVPPFVGIGMDLFEENFDKVTQYFLDKKGKVKEYNFLMAHREKIFTRYFPVINSRLRPATLADGEFNFDKINMFYNTMIKNAELLNNLSILEQIPLVTQGVLLKSQEAINELYENIVELQSSKDGRIRNGVLGTRLNFTSRMVITPIDQDASLDECDIPYIVALELFKPIILQKLCELKDITLMNAMAIWEKATLKFSNLIYKIMESIIKLPNIRLICNRNPTIAIGSMLLLRIRKIKKNVNDMTASIHNLTLASLAGDFDGDVLNFILILSQYYCDLFEPFNPHNIIVDSSNGSFNTDFLPAKDTLLGLDSLFA